VITNVGGVNHVVVPLGSGMKFFRLVRP
jgi:hypothetical protein